MEVYSFNTQPRNMFDDIPMRNYDGMSSSEYMESLVSSFEPVKVGKLNGYTAYDAVQQTSINQVLNSRSQWELAQNITSGTKEAGSLVGFDTETLGYANPQNGSHASAITEFGIQKFDYLNGSLVSDADNHISYAMGVNMEQYNDLKGIIAKYENQGLHSLDSTERSTISRFSMIGSPEYFQDVFGISKSDSLFGGKDVYTVIGLGEETLDVGDAKRGLDRLKMLHNDTKILGKADEMLPVLTDYVASVINDKNTVVFGANTAFDLNWLGMDKYVDKTLDITNGLRTAAAASGESPLTYISNITGKTDFLHTEQILSMDNILGALDINSKQLHTAGKDVNNEFQVATYPKFSGDKDFISTVMDATGEDLNPRQVSFDDTLFLFNRGGINPKKSDYASINGEPISQSYGMTNEYWRVDASQTGTYKLKMPHEENPVKKFIAVYQNAADPNVTIRKEYDNQEAFLNALRKDTIAIPERNVSRHQIQRQHKLALMDKGRRDYEKGINANDVRTRYDKLEGKVVSEFGVNKLLKDAKNVEDFIASDENFKNYKLTDRLYNIVESKAEELGLKSPSQIQSFAGEIERLHYESGLINYISDGIDERYAGEELDDLTKSALFEQAYNNVEKNAGSMGYVRPDTTEGRYSLSDVFAVDVRDTDGQPRRINTYTVESARADAERVFNGMTEREAKDVIYDLRDRGVITNDTARRLNDSAKINFKANEGIYNFTIDFANEITDVTTMFKQSYKGSKAIDNYTIVMNMNKITKEMVEEQEDIINGKKKKIRALDFNPDFSYRQLRAIQNKNLYSLDKTITSKVSGVLYSKEDGKNHHINALMRKTDFRNMVDTSIDEAISSASIIRQGDSNQREVIDNIAKSLNLQTDTQKSMLDEIFFVNEHGTNQYALNNSRNGLQYFTISPRKDITDSAFVLITNDKHVNQVQNTLVKEGSEIERNLADMHINSYQYLRSVFDDNATIMELNHINSTKLNDTFSDSVVELFNSTREAKTVSNKVALNTIVQGRIEKFSTPRIDAYVNKNGKLVAKVGDDVEDMLSAYRMKAKPVIESISNNDFATASSLIRKARDNTLRNLATPSSYRGQMQANGTIARIAELHASDYMNAYGMNIKGVLDIFNNMATEDVPEANPVQQILKAFNDEEGVVYAKKLSNEAATHIEKSGIYHRIAGSNQFEEFFVKNLFLGEGSNNIINAMIETATNNDHYDKSVVDVLTALSKIDNINQILPDSAIKHKDSRFGISFKMPGEFTSMPGLFSTMRPTTTQQNRYMSFTAKDYIALGNLADGFLSDGYTMLGQPKYSKGEMMLHELAPDKYKGITTRFKQVSDADLHYTYEQALNDIESITKTVNEDIKTRIEELNEAEGRTGKRKIKPYQVSEDAVRNAIEYMQTDMSNVNEGKWFVDPLIGQTAMFKDIDSKHIHPFEVDQIQADKTDSLLRGRLDKYINPGDVIAYSENGEEIHYDGPKFRLTQDIKDELINYGDSNVIPAYSMVDDPKFMINSEKATAHTINVSALAKDLQIKENKALDISHSIFQQLFGANIVGNIAATKHNNNDAAWSTMNIIAANFKNENEIGQLHTLMNDIPEFKDWNVDTSNKEFLVTEEARAGHMVEGIEKLEKAIRDGANDNPLYKKIADELDYAKDNNIIYGLVERVYMNEHLSNMFKIDQRVEEGIRLRNQDFWDINVRKSADDEYIDAFKHRAFTSTLGQHTTNTGVGSMFQSFADNKSYNVISVDKARRYNSAALKRQNDLRGILQARNFLFTGEKPQNIVTITRNDLVDRKGNRIIPKNATVDDLRGFIFDVNNKPSEFLQKLADEQNVDLNRNSYSVYFDLGKEIEISLGKDNQKRKVRGVVVPRLNVRTSGNSNSAEYFITSQRDVANFLNSIMDSLENEPNHKDLSTIIETYAGKLVANTQMMDKDSDIYKAVGRFATPNSGEFLAQDETPALVQEMFTDGLYEKSKQLDEIKKEFASGKYDKDTIERYNTLDKELKEGLDKIASKVEKGEDLPELIGARLNGVKGYSSIVKDFNGKKTYNNVIAIGERGMKELGVDFGKVGMDLVAAWQSPNGRMLNTPGMAEGRFVVSDAELNTIVNKINGMKLGFKIDKDDEHIIDTIDKGLRKHFGLDSGAITIEDLNKQLTKKQRKRMQDVFDVFNPLAERYLQEIGLWAEYERYPSFVGQPAVNVRLDKNITGRQVRELNPLGSVYSNVDFDGDKKFLSLILNGSSFSSYDDKVFGNLYKSYLQGMTNNNALIAEMIREGSAFKKDAVMDYNYAYSNMLKSFKEEEFWKAADEYVKESLPDYQELSHSEMEENQGLMQAITHSEKMKKAWEKNGMNTLTDKEVLLASLIPGVRKNNIGQFSTPNFNLRQTMLEVRNNPDYDEGIRKHVAEILADMTNMKISSHGLTGITEQKGIDVKHLIDAHNIAKSPKWSVGMSQMFKRDGTLKDKERGLANLIDASKGIIFKGYDFGSTREQIDDSIQALVKEIVNTDWSELKKAADSGDNLALAKKWLRGVYDFSNIEGVDKIFTTVLKKGDVRNAIIQDIVNETPDYAYGTMMNKIAPIIADLNDAESLKYLKDGSGIYIKPGQEHGTPNQFWNIKGYYKDHVTLQKFKMENGQLVPDQDVMSKKFKNLGSISQVNKALDEFFENEKGVTPIFITKHDAMTKNKNYKNAIEDANNKKMIKTINSVLNGDTESYEHLLKSPAWNKGNFGVKQYTQVRKLFGHTEASIQGQIDRIDELKRAYKWYKPGRDTAGVDALIKDLNQDIVNNPDKYANSTYSQAFEQKLSTIMGNRNLKDALDKQAKYGDIIDAYDEAIGQLDNSLYDIDKEERRLNNGFREIENYSKKYGKDVEEVKEIIGDINERVTNKQQIMDDTLNTLKEKNNKTIAKVQDKVYSLFDSEKKLKSFFGLNKPTGDSRVAFGSRMNIKFADLSSEDMTAVLKEAQEIVTEGNAKGNHATAVLSTQSALSKYMAKNGTNMQGVPVRQFVQQSQDVNDVISANQKLLEDFLDKADKLSEQQKQSAEEKAMKNMKGMKKKRLFDSEMFDDAINFAKENITPKRVGIAVAGLAALGIANNLLHRRKHRSPLTPVQTASTSPSINGNNPSAQLPEYPQQQQDQAPASPIQQRRRVVYHDNNSGLNFRVSAKTKHDMDTNQAATTIGAAAGGGQVDYNITQDTSGVSDNWLANKFAELA